MPNPARIPHVLQVPFSAVLTQSRWATGAQAASQPAAGWKELWRGHGGKALTENQAKVGTNNPPGQPQVSPGDHRMNWGQTSLTGQPTPSESPLCSEKPWEITGKKHQEKTTASPQDTSSHLSHLMDFTVLVTEPRSPGKALKSSGLKALS